MMQPSKTFRKKSGATPAGMFGAAVVSVLLLCGAGNTPTGNIQPGDVNANGHAITNAANVATTNLNVSTMAALPTNTTLGGTNFGAAAAAAAAAGSIDPRTMNLNGCAFVFEGDSITAGYSTASPATDCFGYLASQLPFFKNHGTYYNDGVSGSWTAAGASGGQTVTGSWSGVTTTITLTTSPTAPSGPMSVTGTNIPAGTTGTLSGTTLTLSQATTGSGSSISITLGGNNVTDRYRSQVYPHRPSANGGNGGPRAYLFLLIGTNDLASGTTAASEISALNTYIAQAQSDGFTVIVSPILPRAGWAGSPAEANREAVNAAIRLGANTATGSSMAVASNGVLDYASVLSNAANTAFYPDGLHPTALGHQLIANYINAAMTAGGSQLTPMPDYFGEQVTFNQPITPSGGILSGGSNPVFVLDPALPFINLFDAVGGAGLSVGYTTGVIGSIPGNTCFLNTNSGLGPLTFAINLAPKFTISNTGAASVVPMSITSTTTPQFSAVNGTGTATFSEDSSGAGHIGVASEDYKFDQFGELFVPNYIFVGGVDTTVGPNYIAFDYQTIYLSGDTSTAGQVDFGQSPTAGDKTGSAAMAAITLGGGTKITGIRMGTGTLSGGTASLSDAAITTTSAIEVTHLGSSTGNVGALLAYPTGSGTGSVKSANSSDNDTFTYIVVNH